MIKKIGIKNFGLYKNYEWDKVIGREVTFRRVNIIYGRSYSGKSPLARVFRCVEDAALHKNYCDGDFSITIGNENKSLTQTNFSDIDPNYKIRSTIPTLLTITSDGCTMKTALLSLSRSWAQST